MQGRKVNKAAVNGNNFDTEVVYLVSVIMADSWLLNNLFVCLFINNTTAQLNKKMLSSPYQVGAKSDSYYVVQ